MPEETAEVAKITALDRWLRRSDLTGAEIAPSPDFSQLAVIRDWDDPAQAGLCVGAVEDQVLSPLVTFQAVARLAKSAVEVVITRPCWSADGQWLAFATYGGLPPGKAHRLWIVQAKAGSPPKSLYKGAGIIIAHLWAPDGSCLAVADSDAGLVIVRLDGSAKVIDAQAMRYPLEQNAMAWLDEGQRVVYMNLAPERAGLWMAQIPDGQKRQVIMLDPDELVIPANVRVKSQIAWGALRGHLYQPERGVILYFWPGGDDEPETMPLSNVGFDPASCLLPNDDGSLWAFTVWKGGRRTPFVADRSARQGRTLPVTGAITQMVGWSDAPRKLWVLLHPLQLVGLDVDHAADPVLPTDDSFSIDLTSAELIYLLETLGSHSMLGLINPFTDMPEDEAGKSRENARLSLISKGYTAQAPDNRVRVDLTVAALVQCCASPQQTWTITFEDAAGECDIRHIHQVQALIVEDAILACGTHRLTPLRDYAAVLHQIGQQIHLKEQPAALGQPFVLPEEILFRTREVAAALGEETAIRYLIRAGAPEATAAHFAQALAHPVSNSSISRWKSGSEKSAAPEKGFGILEGASGLWLLQPSVVNGLVQIQVSPADAATVLEQITGLLAWEATSPA